MGDVSEFSPCNELRWERFAIKRRAWRKSLEREVAGGSDRSLRDEPLLLWRAVDEHSVEPDILLQKRRDKAAAKRFFKRVLARCPEAPKKIVTNQLRSYPAAKAEIPELANLKHETNGRRQPDVTKLTRKRTGSPPWCSVMPVGSS